MKSLDKFAIVQAGGLGFGTVVVKFGLPQRQTQPARVSRSEMKKKSRPVAAARRSINLNT
jgi:hypothetical protein